MSRLTFALCLLVGAPAARAGVTLVNPAGGGFDALQAAVDAAPAGEILELLPGDYYSAFDVLVVAGKGVTLVAAAGQRPRLGGVVVKDVPAGQQVLLRGFDVEGPDFLGVSPTGALAVLDCAGGVWIEDMQLTGGDQPPGETIFSPVYPGQSGAGVVNCHTVHLVRCTLTGGKGAPEHVDPFATLPATVGGSGLSVSGATVDVHDCVLGGGAGGQGVFTSATGQASGAGVQVADGQVHLAGCSATGGDKLQHGLVAGPGLKVADALSSVTRRDSSFVAGSGTPGLPDVDAPAGSVSVLSAPARSVSIAAPLHEQQAVTLLVDGQPGDLVALFAAATGASTWLPGKQGSFLLAAPYVGPIVLGVNPVGAWSIPLVAGDLVPSGLQGQVVLLQLVVLDGGQLLVESGTACVLLDASLP